MSSLSENYNHLDNMVLALEQGRPFAQEKRDAYVEQIIEESLVSYARALLDIKSFPPLFKEGQMRAMRHLVWENENAHWREKGFVDPRRHLF